MWSHLINWFKADIKFIVRNPILLAATLAPLFIILILYLIFPPFSGFIFLKTGFLLQKYYTIIAITFISIIPTLYGIIYASVFLNKTKLQVQQNIFTPFEVKKGSLFIRSIPPVFFSLLLILLTVLITNPVPSEGWLRSIYISVLLAAQSAFCFLFIIGLEGKRAGGTTLSILFGIFLIIVPLGLMFHHPWNYFVFFSPFYWISWAWVSHSPVESLEYGIISMVIAIGFVAWFFCHYFKKHSA